MIVEEVADEAAALPGGAFSGVDQEFSNNAGLKSSFTREEVGDNDQVATIVQGVGGAAQKGPEEAEESGLSARFGRVRSPAPLWSCGCHRSCVYEGNCCPDYFQMCT